MLNRHLNSIILAQRLGISQSTVSRALSPATSHKVAPQTRERILKAAADLGYRPNAVARSLKQRRTNTIGFYTGHGYLDLSNDFMMGILAGIQSACEQLQMDLLLHGVYRQHSVDEFFHALLDGRVDGLALHTRVNDPLTPRLVEAGLPLVAIADRMPTVPSVVCDDAAGIQKAVGYLKQRGHEHIAFIGSTALFESGARRADTFAELMGPQAAIRRQSPSDNTPRLNEILAMVPRPTAVCCWNDMTAYSIWRECHQQGVRVPDDLAIIGFDGFGCRKCLAPRLTTIRVPWGEIAQNACQLLAAQIQGKVVPAETVFPVELIMGDTA
jgi:DNA-binding LacI/PurR family transcriptional regulator